MSADTALEVGRLYAQIKRIADVLTAPQKDVFVRLPGLELYWPCGIRDRFAKLVDHTGGGGHLTQVGTCPTGYDGNSFVHLGDGTNYFSNGSIGYFTGTETFISSSIRGMTLGGWFMVDSTPVTNAGLITKDKISPERGYLMIYRTTGVVQFEMSGNGASSVSVASAAVSLAEWHFCVGRFAPGSEIAIFVDGDKNTNTSVIPVSLNVSAQALNVGRQFNDDSQILHGKARDVFLCAAALSDDVIEELRQASVP